MDIYYTHKWVGLRDRRLATLYYLGLLLVTVTLVGQLGWQQAYVDWDHDISGVVRPRLKLPPTTSGGLSSAADAHCNATRKQCETWDDVDLQEASLALGDGAIFIPTRVQERLQERGADGKYVDVGDSRRLFFVAGTQHSLIACGPV
jgi:hypothetical protein